MQEKQSASWRKQTLNAQISSKSQDIETYSPSTTTTKPTKQSNDNSLWQYPNGITKTPLSRRMPSRLPVSLQPGIHSYRRSWICRYRQQPDHQWHSRRKTMYRGYNRKTIMNAVYFDVWNLSCSLHDRLLRGLSNTGKQSRTISLCRLESHNQSQKLFFALSRKLRKKKERKWCISFLLLLHKMVCEWNRKTSFYSVFTAI